MLRLATLIMILPLTLVGSLALSSENSVTLTIPAEGSVSSEAGLEAWTRIHQVASHPRCSNCHVGSDHRPMWSGPSYGRTRPHGMNINAGESRIGAETIMCSTCHIHTGDTGRGNEQAHAAPRVAADWRLPPVEAAWFGRTSEEICAQLRDPERNGGRDFIELADHLGHDVILHWAWTPGGGREPAPYSLQEHVNDIIDWGVAGFPCPQDMTEDNG